MFYIAQISQPVEPKPSSMGVNISLDSIVITGVCVVGTASFGLIRWFLGRAISQIEARIGEVERNQKQLTEKIDILNREVIGTYVTNDEWARAMGATDFKLDALHRRLDEVVMILVKGQKP